MSTTTSKSTFTKFFNKTETIESLRGATWERLVEAFRLRLVGWYFEPFADWPKTGHEAFPVLLAMGAVLSTLSAASGKACNSSYSWNDILNEIGLTNGYRFHFAIGHLARRGRLPDNVGISGLAELSTTVNDLLVGPILVIDPWKLRDVLRLHVDSFCDSLLARPNNYGAHIFAKWLSKEFSIEVGE